MDNDTSLNIIKALADETRLAIVRVFARAKTPMPTCDAMSACPDMAELSQPTVSHHLGKLVDAGILLESKPARQKVYVLNFELLEAHGIDSRLI